MRSSNWYGVLMITVMCVLLVLMWGSHLLSDYSTKPNVIDNTRFWNGKPCII